tara:strand:- start:6249 stop:6761 length:513 start_codon:yes stop_codon:yes gene_type:complete
MVLKTSESAVGSNAEYYIGSMQPDQINLLMIICNHCPYVLYRMPAISQLVKDYKDKINCVAVNSNDSTDYPEDAPELMPAFKEKWDLQCDYIYDEDHKVAKSYGAVCTPEFFLIKNGTIIYHGELDPAHTSNDLASTGSSLRLAIEHSLIDRDIDWQYNSSFGCSIKWKI